MVAFTLIVSLIVGAIVGHFTGDFGAVLGFYGTLIALGYFLDSTQVGPPPSVPGWQNDDHQRPW